MQGGQLVAFTEVIAGSDFKPWEPPRNVVARVISDGSHPRHRIFRVVKSKHPLYKEGQNIGRCISRVEEAYEENGIYYRDRDDGEILF